MDKLDHYEDKHSDQPSKFVEPRKAARLDEEGNVSTTSYLFGQKIQVTHMIKMQIIANIKS